MTLKILKHSVILLSAILGSGMITSVAAQPTQERQKNPYPQEVTDAYLEACLQGSVAQGLTEKQSKSLCTCTLEQFQTRYTFDEFVQVYAETNQSDEPPPAIFDVGTACAATLTQ